MAERGGEPAADAVAQPLPHGAKRRTDDADPAPCDVALATGAPKRACLDAPMGGDDAMPDAVAVVGASSGSASTAPSDFAQ